MNGWLEAVSSNVLVGREKKFEPVNTEKHQLVQKLRSFPSILTDDPRHLHSRGMRNNYFRRILSSPQFWYTMTSARDQLSVQASHALSNSWAKSGSF